jgi:hypothetical protein
MKRAVQYSRRRVRYTGKLDRGAFAAWCRSAEGQSVLKPIIAKTRFSLFGRQRSAQRRVWRDLTAAARSTGIASTMQHHVESHFARLSRLAYARDLPMVGVGLHRLVAVPRLFVNAITDREIDAALQRQPAFASVNGRELLRHWFIVTVISHIDAATVAAQPNAKRPLPAGTDWIIIGVNDRFEWGVPLEGAGWPGHYYLLELTHTPITRAIRKEAVKAIAQLEASLPGLSRVDRNEILRQAGLSLKKLVARAG